jgi:polysaccharide biosynthesis protein PslG
MKDIQSIVLLLLCVAVPGLGFAQVPGEVIPQNFGVNIHFTQARPGEMDELAAAGFKFIRMDFIWDSVEKKKGEYNFSEYDRLVHGLHKHGLRALFILDYNNPLYDDNQSPHDAAGRRAFANMAVAAVRHFAGRGIIWEMWNEPNGMWHPHPDVNAYVKLALTVGKAIKAADPKATLVGPAMASFDWSFLEKCFQSGCLQYWDAVTVHPYRQQDPETVAPDYARLRAMIAQYAPPGKNIPVMAGEWGYTCTWAGFDPTRQAKMLARELLTNNWQHIPLTIWYDWHDDGADPHNGEHNFGTVRYPYRKGMHLVYEPKPAYIAAHTLMTELSGYHFVERLKLPSNDDFCLVFSNNKQVKWAVWTRDPKEDHVVLPVGPGEFSAMNYLGEKLPDLAARGKELSIQAADSPVYLCRR